MALFLGEGLEQSKNESEESIATTERTGGESRDKTFLAVDPGGSDCFSGPVPCSIPDLGHNRQQGHSEVPAVILRAVVGPERPSEITEVTESRTDSAQRSG